MINLFELQPEKIWGLSANDEHKKEKINTAINSNTYVASLKKDGQYHRYVKYNNEVKMQTRGISTTTGTYGDVQEKVPHIMQILNELVPNNSLIIGELYFDGETTNEVGSILRCLPAKAIKKQAQKPLKFFIHDVWFWAGENLMVATKEKRIQILKNIEQEFKTAMVPYYIEFARYVDTVEDIKDMLSWAIANDEEGIVLTLKNSYVMPGAKTAWKTLKVKKELKDDIDVFLTGVSKEPTKIYTGKDLDNWDFWLNEKTGQKYKGKFYKDYLEGATFVPITKTYYYGWPGSLEIAVCKDKNIIPIGWISGLSDDIKEAYSKNPKSFKYKICTVIAMETTKDYKLRHSKFLNFRDDINIEDCTFEKVFGKEE